MALAAFLVQPAAYLLANLVPWGDITTSAVASMYPSLILPADLTFLICGVIFLLQGLFVLASFGVLGKTCHVQAELARRATAPFVLYVVFHVAWLIVWHQQQLVAATCFAAAMSGSATWGYRMMERHQPAMRLPDKIFLRALFRVKAAWLIIATILHFSMLMTARNRNGWDGISEQTWAIAVLVLALLTTLVVTLAAQDAVFGMVALWSYMGILLRHLSTGTGAQGEGYGSLLLCLTICLILQFTAVMLAIHRSRRRAGKSPEADLLA